nr:MAG: RNA replicase beta chain [Sanya fiers-like virus 32]
MLGKYGWDKSTCELFHKQLARIGSLTGAVATIDLSNASDTVCYNLIKLLLPPDWWQLVADTRSSHTLLEGRWVKLEKFSSMGNGLTFELETLVFFTLAKVLQELEPPVEDPYTPGLTTSVYGDDIIVPTSVSRSMVAALKFFGFTPNEKKTFLKGPFRESCGGDYFAGHDVRPHFQKEVCEEPHHLIALANGLRRLGRRLDGLGSGVDHRVAWFRCLDAIPRPIRICRGPEELGDLVIHDEPEHWQSRNPIRVRSSIRYLRVWRAVPNRLKGWDQYRPGVVLSVALYGGSSGTPSTPVSTAEQARLSGVVPRIRGSYVSGYRFGRVAYS